MNITSISLAYVFMGIAAASLLAFVYFKVIVSKTAEGNPSKSKILGEMKHPDTWRSKNNAMSYVSLFWAVVSAAVFIYLKYYTSPSLIPIWYLFIYALALIGSYFFFGVRREKAV